MKTFFTLVLLMCALLSYGATESVQLNDKVLDNLRDRLCPYPKKADFFTSTYLLSNSSEVLISSERSLSIEEKKQIESIFKTYWNLTPTLRFSVKAENSNLGLEGSIINIDKKLSIDGNDGSIGIKQALKTLRQLSEADRFSDGYILPRARIEDHASLKFRAMHICMFPEITLGELEKYVRLASYYKFNYVILEPWGVFPYKSHPEFAYADKKLDRAKYKKLIELCWDLDIIPIPQMSILGHGTQSRVASQKHAVLANNPKMAQHYEVYGWSYCMSNPKTEELLKDMLKEIYEFYDKPPFIHLGCDEAYDMGTCYMCRNFNLANLLCGHLTKFNKYVNKLGARSIIWHDMLLDSADKRWKNHVAVGNAEIAKALGALPKNIIIADWQYSYQDKNQTKFVTPKYFKEAGHEVVVCPWNVKTGIVALARTAKEENLFGFMQTTWHLLYGRGNFNTFFYLSGDAAWNGGNVTRKTSKHVREGLPTLKHLWQIGSDMSDKSYETNGNTPRQFTNFLK